MKHSSQENESLLRKYIALCDQRFVHMHIKLSF